MSAHLTVYAMAIEVERPVRMREADQASRIALAEASSGQRSDRLLRRIGTAIRRFRGNGFTANGFTAGRWAGSRPGGCRVADHLSAFSARGLILGCNDRAASGTN